MRLQVRRLSLVGTSREITFEPGLNVIQGPISTGKSALIRLLSILLGAPVRSINPEVDRAVSNLAGEILIGDETYSVIRPLVQTDTALVQIASEGSALSLPASRPTKTANQTFAQWMLSQLGLPDLRVPEAPTRPQESGTTPVSISDYLAYCRLRQDEIDVDVLGSSSPFRDIKRRYVFRILYGGYDTEVARLQQELRLVDSELKGLQQGERSFSHFLQGTALENRASLQAQLASAEKRIVELQQRREEIADLAKSSEAAASLRARIDELDRELARSESEAEAEAVAAGELREFVNQLETQSARLTRAVVAGGLLHDFDFVVCPRCGNTVSNDRGSQVSCYLCLQDMHDEPKREDLLGEQVRLRAQIDETEDLISNHEARAASLKEQVNQLAQMRAWVGRELDEFLAGFVSDEATAIETAARQLAEARSDQERLREYLQILDRLADTQARMSELEQRRLEIEADLERSQQLDALTASRIEHLESRFAELVDEFEIPEFGGEPRAAINRVDYRPIVNGRQFEGLSAGVRVLVNVAYVLAHHLAALDLDLPLPGILMIDGIQKNIGTAEYDAVRMEHVWAKLSELSDAIPEDLQVVVAVNDVPPQLAMHLRLQLTPPEDRLVPWHDLVSSS